MKYNKNKNNDKATWNRNELVAYQGPAVTVTEPATQKQHDAGKN